MVDASSGQGSCGRWLSPTPVFDLLIGPKAAGGGLSIWGIKMATLEDSNIINTSVYDESALGEVTI